MLARQIAIGFGIAVIFPLLVYYGVATLYPAPKRELVTAVTLLPPNPAPEERQKYMDEQKNDRKNSKNVTRNTIGQPGSLRSTW